MMWSDFLRELAKRGIGTMTLYPDESIGLQGPSLEGFVGAIFEAAADPTDALRVALEAGLLRLLSSVGWRCWSWDPLRMALEAGLLRTMDCEEIKYIVREILAPEASGVDQVELSDDRQSLRRWSFRHGMDVDSAMIDGASDLAMVAHELLEPDEWLIAPSKEMKADDPSVVFLVVNPYRLAEALAHAVRFGERWLFEEIPKEKANE